MGRTSDLAGVVSMLAATAVFVVGDTFMKMAAEELPPFEVLCLRGVAASAGCAALVAQRGEWPLLSGALDPRALLRAAAETLSTLFYVVALAHMPIADVIAILQTAPLMLMLGVAIVMRVRIGVGRVALALVGFVGALLVAGPSGGGASSMALLAVAAAVLIAARDLVGRSVPARIPVSVVTLATMVLETAAAGAASLAFEPVAAPNGRHLVFLALAAGFVVAGQIGLLAAYRLGRTETIAPFFYSFAIWGLLAGLIVWGQWPNAAALGGIGLIVASGVAIVLADRRAGRAAPLSEAL